MSGRRHRRQQRQRTKVVAATFVDWDGARARLEACNCPAIATEYGDMAVVEQYHRHGCPELVKIKRDRP